MLIVAILTTPATFKHVVITSVPPVALFHFPGNVTYLNLQCIQMLLLLWVVLNTQQGILWHKEMTASIKEEV